MQTALWDIDLKYSIIHATIQCKTIYINHTISCIKNQIEFIAYLFLIMRMRKY